MYTEESLHAWLREHTPHITLVSYGGKVKAKSLFRNELTGREFESTFGNIKGDYTRGRNVGLSKQEQYQLKQETWKQKYGVDHPKKHASVQQKYRDTCQEKYGSENYFNSQKWLARAKSVYTESFGVDNPAKHTSVKARMATTNMERYGGVAPACSDEVVQKMKDTTRARYGAENYNLAIASRWDGKTAKEWAAELGLTHSYLSGLLASGIGPPTDSGTACERRVRHFLDALGVSYTHNKVLPGTRIRPDFVVGTLVIECDGLYWHSETVLPDPKHHMSRRQAIIDAGYTPLFFREDEILDRFEIVSSIIKNKLGLNDTYFARKLQLHKIPTREAVSFFSTNHLMGPGTGRTYGLKTVRGELLCAMRVKKTSTGLEISRFCSKMDLNVVGGFSKLLKYVRISENPEYISTFIDLRYGTGEYLPALGFEHKNTSLSFRWVKGQVSLHRLQYPGNSGYAQGWVKLWDCGQARWEKQYD